jgi:3-deoxy-D-manno-octulosonate 8-phosphate phosphatase (KDO 8-P phosphatase)
MKDLPRHPAEALILARVPADVVARASKIRLMIFDVDGVLTDGKLWYGEHGESLKQFHVLDGYGLKMLATHGFTVALMTAREGSILARRAAELGLSHLYQGVRDKATTLVDLAQREGIALNAVGYMGDDVIDLAAMQRAGFAASVPHAPAYIAQAAHWVSTTPGGQGAVRQCCDLLMASQGKLGPLLQLGGAMPGTLQ